MRRNKSTNLFNKSETGKANTSENKLSKPGHVLKVIKNIVCVTLIVVLAFALISFLLVRVSGGTPTVFGYSIQRVSSGSMIPALEVGDIILSKTTDDPNEINTDDIITFKGGQSFSFKNVTHRVVVAPHEVENGKYVLITKGDANESADPEIGFDSVISKYITKLSFLNSIFDLFLSPWGLIIFIALLLLVFFDELMNIIRIATGNYRDEDEESISEIIERIQREDREKEEEKKRRALKNTQDMVTLMAESDTEKSEPKEAKSEENADEKDEE